MIYQLDHNELEKIAEAYNIPIPALLEKIEMSDIVLSFEPFSKGIKVRTQNNESLLLKFKDRKE